jgi:hypothetical protein
MNDRERFRESWERTRAHLNRALSLLPAVSVESEDGRVSQYLHWIEHNELELAIDELEALGAIVGRLLETCPAHWEAIDPDYVSHESSALTAVTPLGWQFLLPAYMIWHLQNYCECAQSSTVVNVISNLTWDEDKDEHIAAGFRTLSPEQVKAVEAFLAYIAGQNDDRQLATDAAKARESYWARAAA